MGQIYATEGEGQPGDSDRDSSTGTDVGASKSTEIQTELPDQTPGLVNASLETIPLRPQESNLPTLQPESVTVSEDSGSAPTQVIDDISNRLASLGAQTWWPPLNYRTLSTNDEAVNADEYLVQIGAWADSALQGDLEYSVNTWNRNIESLTRMEDRRAGYTLNCSFLLWFGAPIIDQNLPACTVDYGRAHAIVRTVETWLFSLLVDCKTQSLIFGTRLYMCLRQDDVTTAAGYLYSWTTTVKRYWFEEIKGSIVLRDSWSGKTSFQNVQKHIIAVRSRISDSSVSAISESLQASSLQNTDPINTHQMTDHGVAHVQGHSSELQYCRNYGCRRTFLNSSELHNHMFTNGRHDFVCNESPCTCVRFVSYMEFNIHISLRHPAHRWRLELTPKGQARFNSTSKLVSNSDAKIVSRRVVDRLRSVSTSQVPTLPQCPWN